MKIYRLYISLKLVLLSLIACACTSQPNEERNTEMRTVIPQEEPVVTVQPLQRTTFYHELVSNGKIDSRQKSNLQFESLGEVIQILVKNGAFVRKGEAIARLDLFKLTNKRKQAEDALQKARLELQDVLIGQGFPAGDTTCVPREIMRLARIKSGYDQAQYQYELAVHEEQCATLRAPFDGVVANLFTKPYNAVDTSKPFCTLIGSQQLEAEFTVLESELPLINIGDRVQISPYADASLKCEGRVTEINPLVDDKGMVTVRAAVRPKGKLFSGMNIRVIVRREVEKSLVVPKSAIVMRSGRQVLFTLKGGKAQWNYVTTGLENLESCCLLEAEGLQEGDSVIVTGNLNLAHETIVKLQHP